MRSSLTTKKAEDADSPTRSSRSKTLSIKSHNSLEFDLGDDVKPQAGKSKGGKRKRAITMANKENELTSLFKRTQISESSDLYQRIVDEKTVATQKRLELILENITIEWESKEAGILTPQCFMKISKVAFRMTQLLLTELVKEFRKARRAVLDVPKAYLKVFNEYQETKLSVSEIVVQEISKNKEVEPDVIDKNVSYYLEGSRMAQLGEEGKALMKEFEEQMNPLPESTNKVTEAKYREILDYQLELSKNSKNFSELFEIGIEEDLISDLILLRTEDLVNRKFKVEEEDCLEFAYQAISGIHEEFKMKNDEILENFETLVDMLSSK